VKSWQPNRARGLATLLFATAALAATSGRADTVASLLGNFTINQYCGLKLAQDTVAVHYVVIYGQLPALRELHNADTNGDGVTSQAERDAYVATLVPGLAAQLELKVDGHALALHATRWSSTLPNEQGGFSLRVDVDLGATLPVAPAVTRRLDFANQNYPGRLGWHEIVVESAPGLFVFDTNAFNTSLTGQLREALKSLPAAGPLDERSVHLRVAEAAPPAGAMLLGPRAASGAVPAAAGTSDDSSWLARETATLVRAISAPHLQPGVAFLALLGALLLGAVHALSPGHGKTIVGAYLIGSRGTPRHAAFLGFTVTVTHTIGVFVLGFATLYASRFIVPERLLPILSLISALLVLGMGVALLVQRVHAARAASKPAVAAQTAVFYPIEPVNGAILRRDLLLVHGHGDGTWHSHGGKMHTHLPPGAAGERVTWRSLVALGVSGGLVPCPSAMVLLLAAVALNKTAYGMLLVLTFSIGLAITLTLVGLMFLHARNRLGPSGGTGPWTRSLPILSAVTITLVGVALCWGALRTFNL
jgi:ABC-type nickel/cobalt efflux system permease component RcnA